MRMDLTGRVYAVSGGGSGIGRATVELLRSRGGDVAAVDRDRARLEEVAAACGAFALVADVGDEEAVRAAFAAIDARFGRLDGALSNAGIARVEGLLHTETAASWDEVIRVNLRGTFLFAREALARMVEAGRGSLVCTSSVVSTAAIGGGTNAYTASKGAIAALVRQLAVDYGPLGIRINAVAPGATDTPLMWDTTPPDQVEPIRHIIDAAVPLGRLGSPLDVAQTVAWLLSDEAAYVTGVELLVDGGTNAKSTLPV
jgi:NAD(P)-dependent dehydrogenase (short-subunit alcohol dehydrogenase family)